jgi:gliding motility-associated-like protein
LVKDTVPNKNPEILSVSVLDDFSVEIKHRSSNEIGFKSYQIYRRLANDELKLIRTTTNVNDTFLVETGLNTLHNVYCYIVTELNTCEYESYIDDSLFHCTIDVKGRPDTNVSILNWNAYYGWKAVEKYEIYRKKETQNQFTKIGEVPGDSLSYNDSSIFCRDGFYYRILAYDKNSNELSWSDTCKVTPIYFNIVPPPKFELSSILNNKKVELYWSKPVNSRNNIIYYVIDRSDTNQNLYRNIIKLDPSIEFYIDGKVDVNNFNYFYKIKAIDECDDISEYSELTSPILLKITLNDNLRPFLFWTPYKKWDEGVAYYEIEQLINGVFTKIGETQTGDDTTFTHDDFIQNCFYPYVYRVFAVKNTNDLNKFSRSLSNEVNLKTKPTIFAPNAFSPNGDGLNDIYEVKGTFIKSITMNIYNRWGEKLYETQNCLPTWDGYYMQKMVPDGVYVALVRAIGTDDQVYTIRTTVTVIK